MRRWLRIVPIILMGSLAVAYVVARPALLARIPHLAILEFPVGALVIALLMWAALARRRPAAPLVPWRRHEQIVRELPDPALGPDVLALERWLESGGDASGAADVIARASTRDVREQERIRAKIIGELDLKSRRKRESLLKEHMQAKKVGV